MSSSNNLRYAINQNLHKIGVDGQNKLNKSNISVVGCGGLGNFVLLGLLSIGVNNITIIDDDKIELSNLHRQILFTEKHIDKNKVDSAKEILLQRNSNLQINTHNYKIDNQNKNELLNNSDIVIDCTDNIKSRLIIDDYCSFNNIPMIYGGVKEFEGLVSVFNYKKGKSFRQTFLNLDEAKNLNKLIKNGAISQVVAITANLQITEVLKIVLGLPNILQGKLLAFDLLKTCFKTYNI